MARLLSLTVGFDNPDEATRVEMILETCLGRLQEFQKDGAITYVSYSSKELEDVEEGERDEQPEHEYPLRIGVAGVMPGLKLKLMPGGEVLWEATEPPKDDHKFLFPVEVYETIRADVPPYMTLAEKGGPTNWLKGYTSTDPGNYPTDPGPIPESIVPVEGEYEGDDDKPPVIEGLESEVELPTETVETSSDGTTTIRKNFASSTPLFKGRVGEGPLNLVSVVTEDDDDERVDDDEVPY